MELKNMKTSKRDLILTVILTIASVGQIISAILLYDPGDSVFLINTGWIVLMLSAVFGWLPIFTFRRKGKVKGRGYIHTTVLVSKGIYSIIRHPQYFDSYSITNDYTTLVSSNIRTDSRSNKLPEYL